MSEISLEEFDPTIIPFQRRVIHDFENFDWSLGVHELLLTGSVGSAKTILAVHLAVRHCLKWPGATGLYGRKAMPDLKETLVAKTLDHLWGTLKEGQDYFHNETTGRIKFANGSKILCRSWSDKRYKKPRSLDLSFAVIEELTENNDEDAEAYHEIKMRIGRQPGITENWIAACTNPDEPDHWVAKYFGIT